MLFGKDGQRIDLPKTAPTLAVSQIGIPATVAPVVGDGVVPIAAAVPASEPMPRPNASWLAEFSGVVHEALAVTESRVLGALEASEARLHGPLAGLHERIGSLGQSLHDAIAKKADSPLALSGMADDLAELAKDVRGFMANSVPDAGGPDKKNAKK